MTKARDPTVEVIFLHLSGAASAQDCIALFASPLFRNSQSNALRVLLDWRSLGEWTSEDWSVLSVAQSAEITRPPARIALVHPTCWKRQAAIFSAILRREKVLVRSWRPEQLDMALAWLMSDVEEISTGVDSAAQPVATRPYSSR